MQEPGLAALYEKFCEAFGRRTGVVVLGLVGAAVAIVSLTVIGNGVSWLYGVIHGWFFDSGGRTELSEVAFILLMTLLLVVVFANIASRIVFGPDYVALEQFGKRFKEQISDVDDLSEQAEKQLQELEATKEDALRTLESAEKLSEELKDIFVGLKEAIKEGRVEDFIKELEIDLEGDFDK